MGGAKNCPETPRQKMIGMMYLVLTAMLALNVSTDILSGFTMVDNSLHSSIAASASQNERLYLEFQAALEKNPAKTQEWYDKAQEVKAQADSLYAYIQNFKDELTIMTDGRGRFTTLKKQGEDPTLNIQNNSNFDVTGTYALVQGHGQELKDNVSAYKEFLTGLIQERDSAIAKSIRATLATEQGYNAHDRQWVDWEIAVFDGMPIGASMAVLSKMQNDVRTTEGRLVQYLMEQTDAGDVRVNKLNAYVIPNSTNVIRGGKYSAQIILAAQDTTQRPQFFVDGVQIGQHGLYEVNATTLGQKRYNGYITLEQNDEMIQLPFSGEYTVSEPAVTISNTDLTIMYRGYENKFSVSVPGISDDKVSVTVTNATVKRQGGLWIIQPNETARTSTITVFAEIEGRKQTMGSKEYRVRKLPDPKAFLTVKEKPYGTGKISLSNLVNKTGELTVSYGEDGILNLPFKVTGFTLFAKGRYMDAKGSKFTNEQLQVLEKAKPNDFVSIEDIKVTGPTGKPVNVDPLTFRIN